MVQKKNKDLKLKIRNSFMLSGKSYVSEKLINNIFKIIQHKTKKDYRLIFKLSLKNILTPISNVTVKKRKYVRLVPIFIRKEKRLLKTIKQIGFTNKRKKFKEKNFISNEIIKLSSNEGRLKNNFKNLNQQFFINKNFTHFRWFI